MIDACRWLLQCILVMNLAVAGLVCKCVSDELSNSPCHCLTAKFKGHLHKWTKFILIASCTTISRDSLCVGKAGPLGNECQTRWVSFQPSDYEEHTQVYSQLQLCTGPAGEVRGGVSVTLQSYNMVHTTSLSLSESRC